MIDSKYKLMSYIGRGSSGKVFLSKDINEHKYVIKVCRKDKKQSPELSAKIIENEHRTMTALRSHPNILKSYGVNLKGVAAMDDEHEDIMYQVLEHAEHSSLSHFIRMTGPLPEEIARLYMYQLGSALEYIHDQGYVHLDVKLENILLDTYFNIKVADFGSSLMVANTNGYVNKRRGTLAYMAPEVINHQPGDCYDATKADIFSLGITFFVLLTGEFPSDTDLGSLSEGDRETNDEYSKIDTDKTGSSHLGISLSLQDLLSKMLGGDPDLRPTIQEVLSSKGMTIAFNSKDTCVVYQEMNARKEYIIAECTGENNGDL